MGGNAYGKFVWDRLSLCCNLSWKKLSEWNSKPWKGFPTSTVPSCIVLNVLFQSKWLLLALQYIRNINESIKLKYRINIFNYFRKIYDTYFHPRHVINQFLRSPSVEIISGCHKSNLWHIYSCEALISCWLIFSQTGFRLKLD